MPNDPLPHPDRHPGPPLRGLDDLDVGRNLIAALSLLGCQLERENRTDAAKIVRRARDCIQATAEALDTEAAAREEADAVR